MFSGILNYSLALRLQPRIGIMKKISFCFIAGALLALSSCDRLKKQSEEEQINTVPKPMEASVDIPLSTLASNKDIICGMPIEAGQIADTSDYQGKIYGFCSKECKAEFVKNPESYLTQK